VILVATLTPIPGQAIESAKTPFLCVACGDAGGADLVSNIVLFLPLGLSLAALGFPWLLTAGLGVALSGFVEGMQYAVVAGRDASLSDLLANTTGTALGWLLMARREEWLQPSPGAARPLLIVWTVLCIVTLLFTRWALEPDLPQGTWYGQWTTGDPEPEFFSGRVLQVEFGGSEVPHWRVPESLRQRMVTGSADSVRLDAIVVAGPLISEPRRVLSLAAEDLRFLSVGTGGGDLSFAVRTRAARLRLLSPRFRLADGMDAAVGDTVSISGRYVSGRGRIRSIGASERIADFRLGWLDPWVFLWPGSVPANVGLWLLRVGTLLVLLPPLWLWRKGIRGS
jgi:hypothetical protein